MIISKLSLSCLCAVFLASNPLLASANQALEDVLKVGDPVAALKEIQRTDPAAFQQLCKAVLDPSFYDFVASLAPPVGPLKRNKVINLCQSGIVFENAPQGRIAQKDRAAEAPVEKVVLRPVTFTQGANVEQQLQELRVAEAVAIENAQKMKSAEDIEAKLAPVRSKLKEAQEHYDTIGAIMMVLREDLVTIRFQLFRPVDHGNDTHDRYLDALNQVLPDELRRNGDLLDRGSVSQLESATKLLKEANAQLTAARVEMQKIVMSQGAAQ